VRKPVGISLFPEKCGFSRALRFHGCSCTSVTCRGGVQISINEEQPDHYLDVSWKKDVHHARLVADMQTRIFHIYGTKTNGDGKMHCVSTPLANRR